MSVRNLVLVLGDQLDPQSAAFDGFDDHQDANLKRKDAGELKAFRAAALRLKGALA